MTFRNTRGVSLLLLGCPQSPTRNKGQTHLLCSAPSSLRAKGWGCLPRRSQTKSDGGEAAGAEGGRLCSRRGAELKISESELLWVMLPRGGVSSAAREWGCRSRGFWGCGTRRSAPEEMEIPRVGARVGDESFPNSCWITAMAKDSYSRRGPWHVPTALCLQRLYAAVPLSSFWEAESTEYWADSQD